MFGLDVDVKRLKAPMREEAARLAGKGAEEVIREVGAHVCNLGFMDWMEE